MTCSYYPVNNLEINLWLQSTSDHLANASPESHLALWTPSSSDKATALIRKVCITASTPFKGDERRTLKNEIGQYIAYK